MKILVRPSLLEDLVLSVLAQFQKNLIEGALISVDQDISRVRILPIH